MHNDVDRPRLVHMGGAHRFAMATSFPKDSSSINLAPAYLRAQPSEMTIATMRDHRHQPIHNCKEAELTTGVDGLIKHHNVIKHQASGGYQT